MGRFADLIEKAGIDADHNAPDTHVVIRMFDALGIQLGEQATELLSTYRRLSYGGEAFVGLDNQNPDDSYLYTINVSFQHWFRLPKRFFVIEHMGDGYFVLCDSNDNMYDFYAESPAKPEPRNECLFTYIFDRLGILGEK